MVLFPGDDDDDGWDDREYRNLEADGWMILYSFAACWY